MSVLDPFAAGLFPICVATHDHGIRQLFDLSTLLLLLDCRPGDRVLDIGAGSGFSSEMLARLGYDVVAVDPDHSALLNNRRRPTYDRLRIEGSVRVTQGVAEGLPFVNASFDGVLGMNVMHHVRDLDACITELARVLRPGRRAVFCEPGLEHLEQSITKLAMQELGENDRAFDVLAFLKQSRQLGFSEAMLTATLQPPLRLLPIDEIDLFLTGQHPRPQLTANGVLEELQRRHAYAMLVREGSKSKTSQHPGLLRCGIEVGHLPRRARAGDTVVATARITNLGDTLWLATPSPLGGYVTLGSKLLTHDGRLISDQLPRTFLPSDLPPGESAVVEVTVPFPAGLAFGQYNCALTWSMSSSVGLATSAATLARSMIFRSRSSLEKLKSEDSVHSLSVHIGKRLSGNRVRSSSRQCRGALSQQSTIIRFRSRTKRTPFI